MSTIPSDLAGIQVLTAADGEAYENSLRRFSENIEQRADYVTFPASAEDVSKVIRHATANNLELAIKCGGHSYSGASSIGPGGLVIDLAKLGSVSVDPERRLLKVGGGASWADVDAAAAQHGLATVGGTVNHTGVGGLTLGGGYGWLTAKYGLTIDVLEEVEIVLANGSILMANERENADLFWAVRGGGSNFGVVTTFTFRAFPQTNNVWSGMLVFQVEKLEGVLNAAEEWTKHTSENESCLVSIGCPPPAYEPVIAVAPFYNGCAEEGKKKFSAFYDLNPMVDMTREMPYAAVNGMMNPMATHGDRKYAGSTVFTSLANRARFKRVFENYTKIVTELPEVKGSAIVIDLHPFHKIVSVPTSATAFGNRGKWYHIGWVLRWKDPKLDERLRAWSYEQVELLRPEKQSDEVDLVGRRGYINYEPGIKDPRDIFGENYERLQQLKAKYDPDNIFHRWFAITPAT